MLIRSNVRSARDLRSRLAWFAGALAATLVVLPAGTRAQVVPPAPIPAQIPNPFDVVGFIDAATVDTPNDIFSGGTITVNGTTIIVPRNTILQFPATGMTWQEVFKLAPAPYGPTQSGLAMSDLPKPPTTYEVHVQGNIVAGRYIAGLLFLSQQTANAGAGFINFIDYATGEMRVGGTIGNGTTGQRVRINDPIGRFGRVTTPDPRFTIDEDNPTVRSETAYPMCVPRVAPPAVDALCPQSNRPKDPLTGNFLTIIEFPPPGPGVTPDATQMMPFEVGDYVTYNGTLFTDAAGPYLSAWGIIANIGAFTAPGTQPAYVAVDVFFLGTSGIPFPGLAQEATVRTRMEGFTTDPTSPVDVFGIDVDPCSGTESDRFFATVAVDPGPPNGAVRGRWRWRPNNQADWLPPTREGHAISHAGVVATPVANGLSAGEYRLPNFDFIFPENLVVGDHLVPANLQDFPFLAQGSGPYFGAAANQSATAFGIVGQLSPWPGDPVPSPVVCGANGTTKTAPFADAGPSQTVQSVTRVTLDGTLSHDTNTPPLNLSFVWVQTSGPVVTLAGPATSRPSFIAPTVALGAPSQTLVFTLTVTNTVGLKSTASVTITVGNPPVDTMTVGTATFRIRRSVLTVNAHTSNPTAVLSLQGFGPMSPGVGFGVPGAPGDFFMIIVGVRPQPSSVTITSTLGGSITVPVTVIP
jgi:hypothetical protein